MSGKAVFQVSGRAMAPVANRLATAPGRIRQTMIAEFRGELSKEVQLIFQDEAPKGETGNLADSIETPVSFSGAGVTLTVRADPVSDTGFHYLDVTRRGRGAVLPRKGRAIAWETADHPVRRLGAWRPAGDWVDRAAQAADPAISDAAETIGRVMATRIL